MSIDCNFLGIFNFGGFPFLFFDRIFGESEELLISETSEKEKFLIIKCESSS